MNLPPTFLHSPARSIAVLGSLLAALSLVGSTVIAAAQPIPPEQIEFFEKRVRPILAQECYECHSVATKRKGGLLLDSREGWEEGGDSGPAILPGDAKNSLLIQTIRHEISDQKMPKAGAKLDESAIADFAKWVAMGAPDPRDSPPSVEQVQADTGWDAIASRRAQWWSFRPVADPEVPEGDATWSSHSVDRFLREAQIKGGLTSARDADLWTVLRRLHYVTTGLPPTAAERAAFSESWNRLGADAAIAQHTDALLQNPHFGERWARHWMDWFRYAEGWGGQGDPVIEFAYEYRDYLIRALNANIPYDQLIREHIAGDLLPNRRIDTKAQIDESRIGIAQFRFAEHGYFPVDSRDELVKFTDNQIDVVTKTALGLTVSCARCHDHKFDPISQKDYHALFGIFASSRPSLVPLTTDDVYTRTEDSLRSKRTAFAAALRKQWLDEANPETIAARLAEWEAQREPKDTDPKQPAAEKKKPKSEAFHSALYPWVALREKLDGRNTWSAYREQVYKRQAEAKEHNAKVTVERIDFTQGLPAKWRESFAHAEKVSAGALGMGISDEVAVRRILPAGLMSPTATARREIALTSPDFTIPDAAIALRWSGSGLSWARLVPNNFPLGGILYVQQDVGITGETAWRTWKTNFWKGERGYFHIMTRRTTSSKVRLPKPAEVGDELYTDKGGEADRASWFHVAELRTLARPGDSIREESLPVQPLLDAATEAPADASALAALYAKALRHVLERWQQNDQDPISDDDAAFLDGCLQAGLIRGTTKTLGDEARLALQAYRDEEAQVPLTRSAPGVIESDGFDQPLYPRGNHLAPGAPVPRAFLAVLGGTPYTPERSTGRLPLAQDLTRSDNPLFPRVIANRLWHYVFGQGIVGTPDNFGRTGQAPTHPELLDHLASRLRTSGYDLKDGIRYLLTTRTFRLASEAPEASTATDPANRLWTHARVRRMDAEIIRDQLLSISGLLDLRLYGKSVGIRVPPEADRRRGVYMQTKREGQNEFFAAFDVPVPGTTRGARDATTTPSQAMTLLNAPFVAHQARIWAEKAAADKSSTTIPEKLSALVEHAYARPATDTEIAQVHEYYQTYADAGVAVALQQTAHLIFNTKEFIYLP